MITERDSIKRESVFDDDRTHRFLWKRVWDKEKPMFRKERKMSKKNR